MTPAEIKAKVITFYTFYGYLTDDENLLANLMNEEIVQSTRTEITPLWDEYTYVVKLSSTIFVGFDYAEATGGLLLKKAGFEFDWNSLREYVPVQVTSIAYKPKGE